MRQIFLPRLLGFERQDEAVGEALLQLLRAVVRAPRQPVDRRDLALEILERLLDVGDLLLARIRLELQTDDVIEQLALRILSRPRDASRQQGDEERECDGKLTVLHGREV